MNPYQISQKISQTHKTLNDLLYNNFEETTGNNRLVINDILIELMTNDYREAVKREVLNASELFNQATN
jgi:hypothetical protein